MAHVPGQVRRQVIRETWRNLGLRAEDPRRFWPGAQERVHNLALHLPKRRLVLPGAKVVPDQGLESQTLGESPPEKGKLAKVAASILMGFLYAARMARFDLLRVTCRLATRITKWTEMDDKRLYRLVCYVHSTLEHRMIGYIGDEPQNCHVDLFTDADFAGDQETARSTIGVFLLKDHTTAFLYQGKVSGRHV